MACLENPEDCVSTSHGLTKKLERYIKNVFYRILEPFGHAAFVELEVDHTKHKSSTPTTDKDKEVTSLTVFCFLGAECRPIKDKASAAELLAVADGKGLEPLILGLGNKLEDRLADQIVIIDDATVAEAKETKKDELIVPMIYSSEDDFRIGLVMLQLSEPEPAYRAAIKAKIRLHLTYAPVATHKIATSGQEQ